MIFLFIIKTENKIDLSNTLVVSILQHKHVLIIIILSTTKILIDNNVFNLMHINITLRKRLVII